MAKFAIPQSATCLVEVSESKLDLRSEAEILEELHSFRPVTSEKNVWAFWDKGIDVMYPSYHHTVINWVRKLGPEWTVRVLDVVEGSPNNVYKFLDEAWFPECFLNKTMDGSHASQHTANLVRLPLLVEYGGVWMDVGNILHTHLDQLFWDRMTVPGSPYELSLWITSGVITKRWGCFPNFIIASRKGCAFIRNWHNCYKELWKGKTNCIGFHKHPLIQDIGLADGSVVFRDPQHNLYSMEDASDYGAHMLIGERISNLLDVETGWNGREFFEKRTLLSEGIRGSSLGALVSGGFNGQREAEFFTTPLDEADEEKRHAAESFIVQMLENAYICKVFHNPLADPVAGPHAFGDLIKREEFRDADHRPGTFGEMYRFGTVHWRSEREVEYLTPQPAEIEIIRATVTASSQESKPQSVEGKFLDGRHDSGVSMAMVK